jgi:hypothetical protein
LVLNATTGVVSGTPTKVESTSTVVEFRKTSTGELAPTQTLLITVKEAASPTIATVSLTAGTRTHAYSLRLLANGNPAGTWSVDQLPAGLTLNATTGVISGTPTAIGDTAVAINFTQASTGLPAAQRTIGLHIANGPIPVITTSALPNGTRISPYSFTLAASGGPGTWTASPLPTGLSLNSSSGAITGTPTDLQTVNVTIGFDGGGQLASSVTLSLQVVQAAAPVISTSTLPAGIIGVAGYSTTLTAAGNPVGTWTASPLPAGLSLDAATGIISGTPTASGTTAVVIGFTQTTTGVAAVPKTINLVVAAVISTVSLPDGTRTLAYPSTTVHAVGDPAGAWTATNLPAGLAISTAGVITGTPTAVGTKTVTLKFTQTANGGAPQVTQDVSLAINEVAAPNITTTSLNPATVNVVYTGATPAVTTTGPPTGTWSATGLPAGTSIAGSTGVISGTPTASGTYAVVLKFTQTSSGLFDTANLNLLVNAAITTASLPAGTRTLAYPSTTVHAVGDPAGAWTATNLPAGLAISTAGVITGTPTAVGTKTVTLKFTQTANGGAPQVTQDVSLAINEVAAPNITTTSLNPATVNVAYTGATPAVTTTGPPAGTWSATGLPAGTSIAGSTGVISGTPTASGTYAVVLKFTQTSSSLFGTANLNLLVNADITTASLPAGTRTIAYSTTVKAAGDPTGTWAATNLPAGLSISTAGVITGTPTAVGTKTVTLTFTQTSSGGAPAVSQNDTLVINEVSGPNITTTSLNPATVNVAYTGAAPAVTTTGDGTGVWSATGLPAGLGIAGDTGVISGTPTASGTYAVVLKFTQTSSGLFDTANLSLVVNADITTSSLPDGTRTVAYPSTTVHAAGDPAGTWAATNLPAGLAISAAGVITGTPTVLGTKTVTLKFTQTANGGAPQVTQDVSLAINEAASPTISTTSLPSGQRLVAYSGDVNATGNPAGTWSATGLPAGLSLDTSTGAITGTPTAAGDVGDDVVTFTFTQSSTGLAANKDLTIHLAEAAAPVITTSALPDGTVGAAYDQSATATGPGDAAGTWSITGLPPGLDFNPSTGEITGTPTTNAVYPVTLNFTQTNSGLAATPVQLNLTINP